MTTTAPNPEPSPETLGEVLVQKGLITREQLDECVRLQKESKDNPDGKPRRLGEILVEKGFVTSEAIGQALAQQQTTILKCTGCQRQFNVPRYNPVKTYRCKPCGNLEAVL